MVVAVDVSPHMLIEAEQNAVKRRKSNIVFRHGTGDDMFDFIYSNIVLQHIHPKHGMDILRGLLRNVAETGGGMIQLIFDIPKNAEHLNRRMDAMPWLWGFRNLRKGRKFSHPRMATYAYPMNMVLKSFHDAGIRSFFSEFTDHSDHIGLKIFFKKSG